METLLTRDEFRNAVFARDGYRCVVCGSPGVDAHHIMDRKLWGNGGYFLSNGATLCSLCHIEAESTRISCEQLREKIGVKTVLPDHLYCQQYDKWGNPILSNGTRLRGELMGDQSVLKIMDPGVVFSPYVKYPRTYHLPWSPGTTDDDRVLSDLEGLYTEIVITEKFDGENTSFYNDHIHARSIDSGNHPSRDFVKAIWGKVRSEIPDGWRICGENVYAKHSIEYKDLSGYFLMFSIWNEKNVCLSWYETKEWSELLGLPMVRELYRSETPETSLQWLADTDPFKEFGVREGYVVRYVGEIHYGEFRSRFGKWVRSGHVQTSRHWKQERLVPNSLKERDL